MLIVANLKIEPKMFVLAVVRVMRGIRFAHCFREVRRRAHQSDSAISSLIEVVFRNMAYRSLTCKLSSHRKKSRRSDPMRFRDPFDSMCLFGI